MKKFGALEETLPEGENKELSAEEKETAPDQAQAAPTTGEEKTPPQPQKVDAALEENGEEEDEEALPEEEPAEEPAAISPPEPEQPREGKQKIALDFEDADIKEVITALAEILDINYIIDPKVRGKVNIHTSGEIPVEGLLPILETIFEVNNVAAVKVGDIYKIIPVKDAEKQSLIPQMGKELEDPSSPDRVILQIVPLRYIDSKEMTKILKRFLGKGGDIVDYPDRNILIILDTAANMEKLLTLIDAVDLSIFDTMHVRFYDLENSEAKDLGKELEELFKALGIETKKKKGGGELVSFIPIERLNVILAVTSMPEMFDKVAEWIERLDAVRDDLEEQIFIYFVENAKAVEIGDIIKELYGEKRRTQERQPTRRTRTRDRKTKTPTPTRRTTTGLGTTEGEIKVVVDETNNAILVRATPQDYAQVLKTIKLLDIIPKQVLIEVLIAEVKLDKNFEFGVEWTFADDYASLGGYKGIDRVGQNFNLGGVGLDLSTPISQAGFTYAFASEALEAFLKAYSRENEVNILSTPHILVADNTEAKIDIGEEVPIVTSEYTPTSLEAGESFSRSIEYRDTGILLTVTPRINDKGLVTMEVNQEVSNVSEQRIEGIDSPIILKRQAETSLVVQDGRTIVIGGLISESIDTTHEGIPFISKIPYLGALFGFQRDVTRKTELLFLITPHVVQTLEEAELVTQEFKEKVKGLQELLQK
jgi:general secretion pathway protein D